MVRRAVMALPELNDVQVNLVWDPPWDRSRMSDESPPATESALTTHLEFFHACSQGNPPRRLHTARFSVDHVDLDFDIQEKSRACAHALNCGANPAL